MLKLPNDSHVMEVKTLKKGLTQYKYVERVDKSNEKGKI